MTMHPLDFAIVGLYLLVMLLVGVWFVVRAARHNRSPA